jgi:hypothetical protein
MAAVRRVVFKAAVNHVVSMAAVRRVVCKGGMGDAHLVQVPADRLVPPAKPVLLQRTPQPSGQWQTRLRTYKRKDESEETVTTILEDARGKIQIFN